MESSALPPPSERTNGRRADASREPFSPETAHTFTLRSSLDRRDSLSATDSLHSTPRAESHPASTVRTDTVPGAPSPSTQKRLPQEAASLIRPLSPRSERISLSRGASTSETYLSENSPGEILPDE